MPSPRALASALIIAAALPQVATAVQPELPIADPPGQAEPVAAATDPSQQAQPRWDQPFTLRQCERVPTALPAGLEETFSTVVTISSPDGVGAGYLASPDGFVFTAAHVVGVGAGVEVSTFGGPRFPAKLVRVDPVHDVALLHVPGNGHPCLVGPPSAPGVGAELYAIGAPLGSDLSHSVTRGIVSGRREWDSHRFIQTDVALNPGNSGGPLMDAQGHVLGIVSWKVAGHGLEGLSFGIPHEAVVDFLGLAWGDTSSDPSDPGSLLEGEPLALPDAFLPVIQRPDGAEPLRLPAKATKASMAGPLFTLAAGGALTAGSALWVDRDPFTTPLEWNVALAGNAVGLGALVGGSVWTVSNLIWNHSLHAGVAPMPNGLALGGAF